MRLNRWSFTRHDIWRSPSAQRPVTVPRHREIPFRNRTGDLPSTRDTRPDSPELDQLKLDDSIRFQPPNLREAVEDVLGP